MADARGQRRDREAELLAYLRGQPLALVDFHATWCQPCRIVSPLVERIARKYAGRGVAVAKVDIDGFPGAAQRFGVQSVPTLMVFRHGEPVDRLVGVPQPEVIVAWLERHLGA